MIEEYKDRVCSNTRLILRRCVENLAKCQGTEDKEKCSTVVKSRLGRLLGHQESCR
jgi:hypothetical protein